MKVENISYTGFKEAIEGARYSFKSNDRSDSSFGKREPVLGPNDLKLLAALSKTHSGSEAKFRRFIVVYADVTAPLKWWKQFDTYRNGNLNMQDDICEMLSTSTMHNLMDGPLRMEDFDISVDDVFGYHGTMGSHIADINSFIELYNGIKNDNKPLGGFDKKQIMNNLEAIAQDLLPESYLQKRKVMLNYQTLAHMADDRAFHKMSQWREFLNAFTPLPYAKELIFCDLPATWFYSGPKTHFGVVCQEPEGEDECKR